MDFSLSPQEEAFRTEVRDWFDRNMKELPEWWHNPDVMGPDIASEEYYQFEIWWHRKMYDAGFIGITWPKEYGGRGGTFMEEVIFNEELSRHRAPPIANHLGIGWCGPAILYAGTEEQKKRFLRKILTAEELWCQGFSEPEAGSDLASVRTQAVEDGDDYVINGQKVWTSEGHHSDWAILLVRTDPDPTIPKHRGLTFFLLDLHSPGVTVRPLRQMTGHSEFNEIFLDNVRIPKSLMVGEKNKGWYVAMSTLEFERSGLSNIVEPEMRVIDLIKLAQKIEKNGQPASEQPVIRQKLAQLYIEANVLKYIGMRALTRQLKGQTPGPESSVGSVFSRELNQRIQEYAMQLQGPYSRLMRGSKYAIEHGIWQYRFLRSRGNTIETGTSEIKRNVIAQRTLGLPR